MKLHELISYFTRHGVTLQVVDGKLGVTADDGVLTAEVMAALKKHKKAVSAYYAEIPLATTAAGGADENAPASAATVPAAAALESPLSFAQRRLYFLYQYDPSVTYFNLPVELGMNGVLDVALLQQAVRLVTARHRIYRSTCHVRDGIPFQRFEAGREISLHVADWRALDAHEQEQRLAALRQQVVYTPFVLESELPLRLHLIRQADEVQSLLLVFHHIATDEWSSQQLIEELSATYRQLRQQPAAALVNGLPAENATAAGDLPVESATGASGTAAADAARTEAAVSYFDFVQWQQQRMASGGYEVARSFWREHLAGAAPVLELPLDLPRPPQQTFKTGLATLALPPALREALAPLLRSLKISEFAYFLGMFTILLNRLTGQRDLVVGTDVFGRDHARFKQVAGFFVNQLAMRTQIAPGQDLASVLQQVSANTQAALQFQEMPFDKVVDDLQIERDQAYSPVFQVKFLYRRNSLNLDVFDGVHTWNKDLFPIQSQYDLTLQVLPDQVQAFYNPDLFHAGSVAGWLDLYLALLQESLQQSQQPLAALLQAPLQQRLQALSHGTAQPAPRSPWLAMAQAAQRFPDKLAVCSSDPHCAHGQRLTYRQLDEKVSRVAQHLHGMGLRAGTRIAVYLERSIDMVLAILAVARIGAVLVPLDTDNPLEHTHFVLDDSGASVVLTDSLLGDNLTEFYGVWLDIANLLQRPATAELPAPDSHDEQGLLYLLYTSGSTGRPKGVLVSRASFANLCDWYTGFANITSESPVLLMIPVGFDASLKNIFAPLMQGATLVLAPATRFDPPSLLAQIETEGVALINTAPSALYALLAADQANDYRSLRGLHMFAVGGEALDLERVRPWLQSEACHAELANIYGPTECTDIAVACKADKALWLARAQVSIGRPIQNLQALIVDDELALCPPGVAGELLLGGAGVAQGYQNLPEASAASFISSPLASGKLYRTGDYCRFDADGNLIYLGRRDGQIKIRGKRVETGEVQAQLLQLLPGSSISVQLFAEGGVEMLLGFVAGNATMAEAGIRTALGKCLPRHAVPARILFIDSMPLTANGKVSKTALLALYASGRFHSASVARELTPTEGRIAQVWQQLLGAGQIDADTSFFAIGGDSIFSIQLVAELKKHGLQVAVADIFKYPTLEQLAGFCDNQPATPQDSATGAPLAPFALLAEGQREHLPQANLADAFPVTALQQGMLFHCQMDPHSAMYHDVFSFELGFAPEVPFERELLVSAITRVVAANPALRTGFDLHSFAEPLQLVYENVTPLIDCIDLSRHDQAAQAASVEACIARLKQTGFDLQGPSLIRFTLLQKAPQTVHLIIDAHHAILDGWSMATLQRQIFEFYRHLQQGSPLADVFDSGGIGFADYVGQQIRDEQSEDSAQFWQAYCHDSGAGALAAHWPEQAEAAIVSLPLPAALVQALAGRIEASGTTLKTLLTMAHAWMLRSLLASETVLTVLTDNGRPEVLGAQNIVGLFVNVLPLKFMMGGSSWQQLASSIGADEIARKPHRRYPFAHIVRNSRQLQADTMFTYNNFHVTDVVQQAGWLSVTPGNSYEETNFKLAALVNGNLKAGLTLTLEVRIALTEKQIATLQNEFQFALHAMAHDWDSLIPQRSARLLPRHAPAQEKRTADAQAAAATQVSLRYRGAAPGQAAAAALARFELQWAAQVPASGNHTGTAEPLRLQHETHGEWQTLHLTLASAIHQEAVLEPMLAELLDRLLAACPGASQLQAWYEGQWWPLASLEPNVRFWRGQLQQAPSRLNLPYSHAPALLRDVTHAVLPFELDAALTAALQKLAAQAGVTLRTVLLGSWFALLSRLSSQSRLICGVPAHSVGHPGLMPLALDVEDDPAVPALLQRVAQLLLQVDTHLAAPASLILPPPQNGQCLLQAAFVLHDGALTGERIAHAVAHSDLALQLNLPGSGVELQLHYARDVFEPGMAGRISQHWRQLLASMAAAPQLAVSRLALLTPEQQQQLLHGLNQTDCDFGHDLQLHQMVEQQAAQQPDALALMMDQQRMSYAELNRDANRVAHFLRQHGIGHNDRVAICLDRSVEMVAGILGILKAGAAYMPLDPVYPRERIAYMLEDSAPKALLTSRSLQAALPVLAELAQQRPCLLLEPGWHDACAALPDSNLPAPGLSETARNLLYVLYTSGSTGQPKGVAMAQGPLVNLILWQASPASMLAQRERTLQFSALGFDATFQEIFSALCYGASLVLVSEATRRDPRELVRVMQQQGVQRIFLPFVALQNIAEAALDLDCPLPQLKTWITAGEQLRVTAALQKFFALVPGRELHNYYGPTESHVVTTLRLAGDPALWPALPSIGKPIANTRIYILDAALQLTPQGVPGEVYIAGAALADGYLNRPALTRERFVANPFDHGGFALMYKTGDIGRWLQNGEIEYLGRNDSQVKIRGYRIEPGEIESVLASCQGVREVAVLAREDEPGNKQLVAYLVAHDGVTLDAGALRDDLAAVLPEYMVPSAFVVMPAFPVSPNGKLDRRALPAPDSQSRARSPYAAPQGRIEHTLAHIWQELLGISPVGRADHFFELGGHSLLAVRLASRIRQQLALELPLRELFAHPVLSALALVLEQMAADKGGPLRPSIGTIARQDRQQVLPLSFAQQRLWFVQQLEDNSATYNMPAALRLQGALDAGALARALNWLVARHEVLRSNFVSVDGQPRLMISEVCNIAMPLTEVQADQVAAHAARHANHRFDLASEPLLRTELLRISANEHVLLLNIHHIICDGWSLNILADEWLRSYDALCRNQPPALPPLSIQYADYAAWQHERLTPEVQAQQLAYWCEKLDGAPELLNLPTDWPRPAVQRFEGADEQLRLSPALSQQLRELGQREGASLFMTLLSAFAVLLARQSGDSDLTIGAPLATRDHQDLESMLGILLGNLVLRIDTTGAPSFAALLAQVKQTMLEALENSAIPFEQIVDALPLRRDLSRNPLFQVFFNMLNLPQAGYQSPHLQVSGLDATLLDAKFDLTLYAQDDASGLLLHLVYNRTLFGAARMQEMLRQLHTLLEQICQQPQQAIDHYSLQTAHARALLPDPRTPLDASWHGSIATRFAALLPSRREALAVVAHDRSLSWEQLDQESEQIACWLQAQGVQPGQIVAIAAARCAGLLPAVLGVMKAGAAFTLLDPAYPAAHLAACIAIARPVAWLQVAPVRAGSAAPAVASWLNLSQPLSQDSGCAALLPFAGQRAQVHPVGPADLALLSFTSGSSGVPKAVEGVHGALTHFFPWVAQQFGLGPQDRFAMLSGLAHDPLQRDMFNALWFGATLCIPHPDQISPRALANWMQQQQISAVNLTPAMLQILCTDAQPLPQLQHAFLIGDVLTRSDVAQLQAIAPAARVVSYYGATETQRAFGYHIIEAGQARHLAQEVVPLGSGMPGVQLLLLNRAGQMAGIGEAAEIVMRTPHLARGYRDDAELTRQRFLRNPWLAAQSAEGDGSAQGSGHTGASEIAGDRLYRTGDLGRYSPDGSVQGLGRADGQVKLRGFRIELGHIESVLAQHPAVQEAVVLLHGNAPTQQLVAWLVLRPHAASGAAHGEPESALRSFLQDKLPDYMRPASYVLLPRLPLTPNGKLDRRALPAPAARAASEHVAPRDALESTLCQLMAEVLGHAAGAAPVGIHDNFFDLGGHSLLATRLVSRIASQLQVQLPLKSVFEAPQAAALAQKIRSLPAQSDTTGALPPVLPQPAAASYPLAFPQQRLWFLDQFEPGNPFYNMPLAVRLQGRLDPARLQASLNALALRHVTLRTRFMLADGQAVQAVQPLQNVPCRHIDISTLAGEEQELQARLLANEAAMQPFDLQHGHLLRACLLRLHEDSHVLVLTLHHIISDGWSMGILIQELASLYQQSSHVSVTMADTQAAATPVSGAPVAATPVSGAPVAGDLSACEVAAQALLAQAGLPALPVQYPDFAHWQNRWLASASAQQQQSYWMTQLQGAPTVLNLPFDRPRPALQSYQGATHHFVLDAPLTASLRALAAAQAAPTTLFMLLSAAFNVLLYRHSGQNDICIGLPIANRRQQALEGLIGFFANTLVLRTRLDGAASFENLLAQVRHDMLDAFAHQDLPFEKLVEALKPERHTSHAPLFQVMLSLQDSASGAIDLPGLQLAPLQIDSSVAKFDLTLSLAEEQGQMLAGFEYNTDLFERSTIERWAGHFTHLLQAIVAQPQQAIGGLPLLGQAELQQVTLEWNRTAYATPDTTLPALFAAAVARHGESTAVIDGSSEISYSALNARVQALARRLRGMGVRAEQRVGLCVTRSIDMVAGQLAILQAGGAYVPFDPAQPADRLLHMLADSAPVAMLTQSRWLDHALVQACAAQALPVVVLDQEPHPAQDQSRDQSQDRQQNRAQEALQDRNPAQTGSSAAAGWPDPAPHDLAYVLYTSGSTGMPKGVMVEHGNVVNTVLAHARQCAFAPQERILQFVSYGFDVSVGEIFTTLCSGATLVIKPDHLRIPDAEFVAFLDRHQIRVLDVPTAFWHQWMQEIVAGRCGFGASVRLLITGGEKAELRQLQSWFAHPATRNCRWINAYGPTEATVNATYLALSGVTGIEAFDGGDIPIGRPLDNTRVYILDAQRQPVGQGIPGELYLAGAGVARGYLGRPDLSALAFLPDPFDPAGRMYKTGDLGRWLADGNIEYLGRNDSQVKLRGYRIELGEIQSRLAALAAVREAFVALQNDAAGQARIVAWVVLQHDIPLDQAAALRQQLAGSLPEYMLPAVIVPLAALPLNANGKVDVGALPPASAALAAGRAYLPPVGEAQIVLAGIWQTLLGVAQVGQHDHFFELGGHSLMVVTLIDQLRQHGLHADVRAIFTHPTLAAMAGALSTAAQAAFVAPPNLIPSNFGQTDAVADQHFEEFDL